MRVVRAARPQWAASTTLPVDVLNPGPAGKLVEIGRPQPLAAGAGVGVRRAVVAEP